MQSEYKKKIFTSRLIKIHSYTGKSSGNSMQMAGAGGDKTLLKEIFD